MEIETIDEETLAILSQFTPGGRERRKRDVSGKQNSHCDETSAVINQKSLKKGILRNSRKRTKFTPSKKAQSNLTKVRPGRSTNLKTSNKLIQNDSGTDSDHNSSDSDEWSKSTTDNEKGTETETDEYLEEEFEEDYFEADDFETEELDGEDLLEDDFLQMPKKRKTNRKRKHNIGSAMNVNQELVTKEEINSTWTDMEIELLRDSLEEIRKKGGCLGLYGLSDKQARYCKERIKTKTVNQIKDVVFANVNEHVLTTDDEPIDQWNQLFQFMYTTEGLEECKENLNRYFIDRAKYYELENNKPGHEVSPNEPNMEEIYKYLSAILKKSNPVTDVIPALSQASAMCLLNCLENIEKQARLIHYELPALEHELNDRRGL